MESGAPAASSLSILRAALTRGRVESETLAERTLQLANALQQEALTLIEAKGADMTAGEAQRVLRLFLLRRLLTDGAEVKELAAIGREIGQIFPAPSAGDSIKVSI